MATILCLFPWTFYFKVSEEGFSPAIGSSIAFAWSDALLREHFHAGGSQSRRLAFPTLRTASPFLAAVSPNHLWPDFRGSNGCPPLPSFIGKPKSAEIVLHLRPFWNGSIYRSHGAEATCSDVPHTPAPLTSVWGCAPCSRCSCLSDALVGAPNAALDQIKIPKSWLSYPIPVPYSFFSRQQKACFFVSCSSELLGRVEGDHVSAAVPLDMSQ